jgi:uncharacterized damage-inducible protein DinB
MTEVKRILDQYDRAMNGDAWHGDPVWKILEGISAEQAATRPEANTHTIWELVAHMTFWETVVYRRLNNLPARSSEELNFPAMPEATDENWNATLAAFRQSNADFRKCLLQLDPARLEQTTPGRDKTVYVEVHGVIQHHLYHAGQIAVLRHFRNETRGVTDL